MVSFGQGCEGEPLTRWRVIAEAIRRIRARDRPRARSTSTPTPASPRASRALYDAGLDSIRVSLNSAVADLYEAYYRPERYGWSDVEASIALSRERGAYLALNLLTFPGVTDREGEVEALLVARPAVPGGPGADPEPVHRPTRSTWRWRATGAPGAGPWALPGCCGCSGRARRGSGWGTSPGDSANEASRPARPSAEPSPGAPAREDEGAGRRTPGAAALRAAPGSRTPALLAAWLLAC